jgi:hypothetical protein
MTENTVSRLWFMRTMFILLSVGVIFLHLLPLSTLPRVLLGIASARVCARPADRARDALC